MLNYEDYRPKPEAFYLELWADWRKRSTNYEAFDVQNMKLFISNCGQTGEKAWSIMKDYRPKSEAFYLELGADWRKRLLNYEGLTSKF